MLLDYLQLGLVLQLLIVRSGGATFLVILQLTVLAMLLKFEIERAFARGRRRDVLRDQACFLSERELL